MPFLATRRALRLVCPLMVACLLTGTTASAQTFKLAYWNIKSGKGQIALPGHPVAFVDTSNCTDPSQPLDAWGVGLVPQELAKLAADPRIVARGLGEAWVCGAPHRVRDSLGWAASVADHNGVSISPGDRFRIAVENGAVKYFVNATLVYVSVVAPASPLALNVALLTLGAAVENAVLQVPETARAQHSAGPTVYRDRHRHGGAN